MKKIFLTSLVLLLSISLVACNKNEKINGDDISLEETLDEEGIDKSFRLDSKLREFIKENIYTTARNNHDTYFSFSQKYDHIDETIEKAKASVDEFKKALEDDESKLTDIEKLKGYSEEEIYNAMIVTFSVYDIRNAFSLPSDYDEKMEKINEQKFEMERRKEDVYRQADNRFNKLYGTDNSKVKEEIDNKWNELIENAKDESEREELEEKKEKELEKRLQIVEKEKNEYIEDMMRMIESMYDSSASLDLIQYVDNDFINKVFDILRKLNY